MRAEISSYYLDSFSLLRMKKYLMKLGYIIPQAPPTVAITSIREELPKIETID